MECGKLVDWAACVSATMDYPGPTAIWSAMFAHCTCSVNSWPCENTHSRPSAYCLCVGAYLMYGNTSAEVGLGGILRSGSFYMCPIVQCMLCSENVHTAHCMKQ